MDDEQKTRAIVQWLLPSAILLIVIIVMLASFSAKSQRMAESDVRRNIYAVVDSYASQFGNELREMTAVGVPVAETIAKYTYHDKALTERLLSVLCNNSKAYQVLYVDLEGNGTDQDGKEISIGLFPYFSSCNDNSRQHYFYTKDDRITGQEAAVSVIPVAGGTVQGVLLMFYPLAHFQEHIRTAEFDGDAFFAVVAPEGNIMARSDSESAFLSGDNLWNTIGTKDYSDQIDKMRIRIRNKNTSDFTAAAGGETRRLTYSPLNVENWALVAGINQDYIDSQQAREWNNTKQMLYQLIIATVIFLGVVVTLVIVNKIRSNEKSKELEEKADTDLLTGLNNKLATERKIKEYIAKHPDEQAMLFVLDIDNFKKINDTLGHAFGDEVLRALGHGIGSYFRATDVIGRTGGDEFTIFLKNITDDSIIEKEASKVCQFFKNFQAGEYVKYSATASIGAAIFSKDGKDFESLYKAADQALYTAKKRGKNQMAFYGGASGKALE